MKQRTWVATALLLTAMLFLGALAPQRTLAVTARQAPRQVSYVIAFEPIFGAPHIPYLGWLQLSLSPSGIFSGTYRGLSILPDDPFVNRITPVSGGISGNAIHFDIGNGPAALSFNGRTFGQWIEGSATWRGQIYRLTGRIGRPRGM